jgi:hypothetical protein
MGDIEKSNTCGFVTTIAYDKLKAENAKLRELLLEAYETATEPDCGGCYHVETCNEMPYCVKWVELEHRMRDELGIEVSK